MCRKGGKGGGLLPSCGREAGREGGGEGRGRGAAKPAQWLEGGGRRVNEGGRAKVRARGGAEGKGRGRGEESRHAAFWQAPASSLPPMPPCVAPRLAARRKHAHACCAHPPAPLVRCPSHLPMQLWWWSAVGPCTKAHIFRTFYSLRLNLKNVLFNSNTSILQIQSPEKTYVPERKRVKLKLS